MFLTARARLRPVAWYAGNALLSILILVVFLRLWRIPLHDPICYGDDGLQYLLLTKTIAETGWGLDNPRLAAPGQMNMRLFPFSEGLNFVMLRGLVWLCDDPFVAANLFIYLGFPLAATTAFFVFRRQGGSLVVSALGSQLFAFLPYHLLRILLAGHVFLGTYWLVPLAVWIVLRLYGVPDSDEAATTGPPRRWLALSGACVFSFFFAGAGVYYAFFYCFLLCLTGLRAVIAQCRWATLGAAALLVTVTGAGVFVNLLPYLPALRAARAQHQGPLLDRTLDQSDTFGLRIIQIVLPISHHRLQFLRQKKYEYNIALHNVNRINENDTASLGFLGAAGFVILLGVLLRPRAATEQPTPLQALSVLNLGALLLGTVGGLGAIASFAGVLWIRGYNRISVFIGFFALFTLVLLFDRLRQAVPARWRWGVSAAFVALAFLGLLDQIGPAWKTVVATRLEQCRSDRPFAHAIEAQLPPGSSVFQLPCCMYPEHGMPTCVCGYDLAAPYLHTRTLRWSYGTHFLQPEWQWQQEVSTKPAPLLVAELRARGFAGLYLDRRGFFDRATQLEEQLIQVLGVTPLVSPNGNCAFYSLMRVQPPVTSSATTEASKTGSIP